MNLLQAALNSITDELKGIDDEFQLLNLEDIEAWVCVQNTAENLLITVAA